MKCYRYTIESIGGVKTEIPDLPCRVEFDPDTPMININDSNRRIILPMRNVVRITEEEIEV